MTVSIGHRRDEASSFERDNKAGCSQHSQSTHSSIGHKNYITSTPYHKPRIIHNMVSFSPNVSVREYQRILDCQAADTFLALTIGWNYSESSLPVVNDRQPNNQSPVERPRASDWQRRLEIFRDYGFDEEVLNIFWTQSRRRAVRLCEQQEQERRRNDPVTSILTSMLLEPKEEIKTTTIKQRGSFFRRRRKVGVTVDDTTLHKTR
jgi:hypothetical protein